MFSLFYSTFTSEYVYAVFMFFFCRANVFALFMVLSRANMFTLFLCYFSRANVFTLFMVLSRANMFTLFYVIFSRANVFALFFWYFHERICLRCFMLFFSSECVCAVHGIFTSECVFAEFTLFLVPSRANMSSLFMVFFSSECAYAVYGTFTSEYVYYVFCFFFLKRMCLRWVICSFLLANMFSLFMAPYNISTLLWYFFYQRANMLMLLCGTLTSEYVWRCYMLLLQANMATLVYGILSQAIMFARLYGIFCQRICSRCYAFLRLVLFMLLARSGFTRSVFIFCLSCVWLNQIDVAALSVKIEALEKQVSADSVDRALVCVRQLADRPVGLSDGTAIVAALESLADVSRSAGHVDFKRHEAILKQCRPLTHDPRLPAVVTQLLGDDESKKIAGQIQKILKSDHLFSAPQVHGSLFPAPARAPGYLRQQGSGRGRYTPYGYGS